jgi:hypothetical protein
MFHKQSLMLHLHVIHKKQHETFTQRFMRFFVQQN